METCVAKSILIMLHCDLFSFSVHYVTLMYYRCVGVRHRNNGFPPLSPLLVREDCVSLPSPLHGGSSSSLQLCFVLRRE